MIFFVLLAACNNTGEQQLSEISLDSYQLPDDMKLEVLVSEPWIESPIDISFDDFGNLWTIEMPGYMQNLDGLNEDAPIGRIQAFIDTDKDGSLDKRIIVKDSLELVRAFSHVYGGLLYAVPPNLYFAEITEDFKLENIILVDDKYAIGGNVEHQPNGLMMNMDNWIYSAKSTKRYRRKHGTWEIERTGFRGQWGISHDRYGRLIYNDNSNPLRGDVATAGLLSANDQYIANAGFNQVILKDRKVNAIQATAVNRGYMDGVLDEDEKLVNFTSACSPVYFEGRLLDRKYAHNVYICAPEVNLIKRVTFDQRSLQRSAQNTEEKAEFLVSSDEAFRPVNLKNGPDGGLYIVDMHKGIIQHKTYMTSYLREKYIKKGLDKVSGMGRILRITNSDSIGFETIDMTRMNTDKLVYHLGSRNIWMRDRAQQLIIRQKDKKSYGKLVSLFKASPVEETRIMLLYILDELDILQDFHLNIYAKDQHYIFNAHLIKFNKDRNVRIPDQVIKELMAQDNNYIDYHLLYYLADKSDKQSSFYLRKLVEKYHTQKEFMEPLFAGMQGNEKRLAKYLYDYPALVEEVDKIARQVTIPLNRETQIDGLTAGLVLYNTHCSSCHDAEGKGIDGLGPPLLDSEYVSGSADKLVSIMLYGLSGPLIVNGKEYNDGVAMPGLGSYESISDREIVDIANYVRNAFTTSNQSVTVKRVNALRSMDRPKDKMFTSKELDEIYLPQ